MADDLVDRLKGALAAAYEIRSELGGGGMSRVFVADDRALGRPVVIKVLHPELAAGVNADRFNREVQLSARLQHPHIVPVLTAGQVEGLPYYVMPFVRGESLRARIARGPLPAAEAISLLTDVAKALSVAHAEGVVHRDIKPDNILISGGAAVVADFGIAKALSSARATTDENLTTLGTSLGTPAYMAPEQIAGDPNVDHRADIYSLGCVAFEMVTGRAPFAGKSPQQTLAAHVVEPPPPVAELNPSVPPALAALIAKCLEKEPSKRPQSAAELAQQLEATTVTGSQPTVTRRNRTKSLVAVAVVAASAAVAVSSAYLVLRHRAPVNESLAFVVVPFDVLDPQLALWKEGMVDVLSRNLDGAGTIRSISPSAAIKKWEGHADRASAAAFGKRVGARIVAYGQLQSAGRDSVSAKVWIVDTERDAPPVELEVRDSIARMDRVSDSLSVRLLSAVARDHSIGTAHLGSLGSGSLPAIKAFLQGSQYFRRTQWDSAVVAFREATVRDSTFALAYLQLGQAFGWSTNQGNSESVDAYRRAGELIRPGLSPRDSLMLTAVKHYINGQRTGFTKAAELRAAFEAGDAATRRYPDDAEIWYLVGDMHYHFDNTLSEKKALEYFDHAVRADSGFAPAYIHAIELAFRHGPEEGRRYANAYLARDPRDVEGSGIAVAARLADPAIKSADLKRLLDTLTGETAARVVSPLMRLTDSAEVAIQMLHAVQRIAKTEGQQRSVTTLLCAELSMRGHIAEAWKASLDGKCYQAGEIAGLGLVSADSATAALRPWLEPLGDATFSAIPAFVAAHDTLTLMRLMQSLTAAKPQSPRAAAFVAYADAAFHAYMALARNDSASATKLFDAIPDSIVSVPYDQFVRATLLAKSNPRRALELLDRRAQSPDLLYVARELERGRVAESLGEKATAVDAYSFVADAWRNAEPQQLKDAAKEARTALQRLDADGRLRAELKGAKKG